MKPKTLFFAFALFLTGCAAVYKPIIPTDIYYLSKIEDKSVTLEYEYSLLPRKYAKKEIKNNIRLVALRITNHSGQDLVFGENVKLYFNNNTEITMLDKDQIYSSLRQKSEFYLFYLLLLPLQIKPDNIGNQPTKSIPIGLGIAPGLAAGNIILARSANSKFKKELNQYYLPKGAILKSNTTVYGLIGIRTKNYEGLLIKVD